jgi:plastocyanin
MKGKAFEWTARWNPQGFVEDPATDLVAPRPCLAFRHFALLAGLFVPLAASAENWQMQVGAQTGDKAHQALAFLPNEIWIHPGESITWTFPPASFTPSLF